MQGLWKPDEEADEIRQEQGHGARATLAHILAARAAERPARALLMAAPPFRLRKIGHVVLRARDLARSVEFYTQVLGFRVSDTYPESMMPGGMVFMRCNADHHGIALVGGMAAPSTGSELHHMAFEVESLDEVFHARRLLRAQGVPITFEGRRRAGVQIAVEFQDPDGHQLEIYWGLDQLGEDETARPAGDWRWAHTLEEAIRNPPPGQNPVLHDPTLLEERKQAAS